MMLRKGGCEDMLDSPPEAAVEAVELCKRLPLTVSIAGGMIDSRTRGKVADSACARRASGRRRARHTERTCAQ